MLSTFNFMLISTDNRKYHRKEKCVLDGEWERTGENGIVFGGELRPLRVCWNDWKRVSKLILIALTIRLCIESSVRTFFEIYGDHVKRWRLCNIFIAQRIEVFRSVQRLNIRWLLDTLWIVQLSYFVNHDQLHTPIEHEHHNMSTSYNCYT